MLTTITNTCQFGQQFLKRCAACPSLPRTLIYHRKVYSRVLPVLCTVAAILFQIADLRGQSTWVGITGFNSIPYTSSSAWSGGNVPASSNTTAMNFTAAFPTGQDVYGFSNFQANSITFGSSSYSLGFFGDLFFTGATPTITSNSQGTFYSAPQTGMTFNLDIASALTVKGAGNVSIDLRVTGNGSLVIEGPGRLSLNNSINTYTGGTVVKGGLLSISNDGSLGQLGKELSLDGGGTLVANNITIARSISLGPSGGGFSVAGSVTLSGPITGSGALSKTGTGTLSLTSSNVSFTGNTVIQAGTLDFAPASGIVTVASTITGAGTLSKSANGTVVLTGANTHTGPTNLNAGTLRAGAHLAFSPNSSVNINSIATLDVNGFNVSVGSLTGNGNVALNGGMLSIGSNHINTAFGGTINAGTGGIIKLGTGSLNLFGSNLYTGTTTIQEGTLELTSGFATPGGTIRIEPLGKLQANSNVVRSIAGIGSSSEIAVGASGITLGEANSFAGFSHAGTLDVGNNTVSLESRGFASLGVLTTLTGGTINAANGVSIGVGSNLSGNGTVSGKLTAGFGSTIEASGGNMSLGTASSSVGFASDGELYTGVNNVTLHDSNQAVLGSYTLVGAGGNSGTLTAANGILLEQGKNLEGQGLISSTNTLAKAVFMNGYTNGTGTGLVFNGYIKGTGIFDGTVSFTGTLAPGLSPTSSTLNNMILGTTSTLEMELGGTQLGLQYDHLNFMGMGSLNGTLNVVLINGFQPSLGNTFNLFDGSTSGSFSSLNLPELTPGLTWDTSQLYTAGSLSVIAIPEPGTFTLIGGCIIGMTMLYRKRG